MSGRYNVWWCMWNRKIDCIVECKKIARIEKFDIMAAGNCIIVSDGKDCLNIEKDEHGEVDWNRVVDKMIVLGCTEKVVKFVEGLLEYIELLGDSE